MWISLAILNETGTVASICDRDSSCTVAVNKTRKSPRQSCLVAAKRLRKMADRFILLADECEPFQHDVQQRINGGKAYVEHEVMNQNIKDEIAECELSPCPHCGRRYDKSKNGSLACEYFGRYVYTVFCKCGAAMIGGDHEDRDAARSLAVKAWKRRTRK